MFSLPSSSSLLKVPILFVAQPPYPLPQYKRTKVEVKLSEGLNGVVAFTVDSYFRVEI